MGKIKQFIGDHKKGVIGTTIGVIGAVASVAAYRTGFKHGCYATSKKWMAMLKADPDRTLKFVDWNFGDLGEDVVEKFVTEGHRILDYVTESITE